jgi:hypothetical protein
MTQKNKSHLQHPPGNPPLSEVTVLIQAVEGVFRKLIRLLIGRISLKKLQQLIQVIFIEEVEARLKKEAPKKSPTLADTVLLTGMDIRTIKKTKKQIAFGKPIYHEPAFLNSFMPMFKVLDLWLNNEEFFETGSGKPKTLSIQGDGPTFSRLVNLAIPYRGLSANQILRKLEQFDAVSINDKEGTVTLVQQDNVFISKEFSESLNTGFAAIENLVETVGHNLECLSDQNEKFFQEECRNYQFDSESLDQGRETIDNYLKQANKDSEKLLASLANSESQNGQVTVGIGMFYFEEDNPEA